QLRGQRVDELVLGDAHRLVPIAERVLSDDLVLALAQQEPDGRRVFRRLDLRVDGREIEAELTKVLGLEVGRLELDDDVGAELQVIKEEIEKEVLPAHLE